MVCRSYFRDFSLRHQAVNEKNLIQCPLDSLRCVAGKQPTIHCKHRERKQSWWFAISSVASSDCFSFCLFEGGGEPITEYWPVVVGGSIDWSIGSLVWFYTSVAPVSKPHNCVFGGFKCGANSAKSKQEQNLSLWNDSLPQNHKDEINWHKCVLNVLQICEL